MSCSMNSGVLPLAFVSFIIVLLSYFPGRAVAAVVTLRSIELYRTHEWVGDPTVYFQCKDENKTVLLDVKKKNVVYTFNGEESWQPLTEFSNTKCKRCGLYEKDVLRNEVFDEWELCPFEFKAPHGIYTHVKEKEFNATFSCPECLKLAEEHKAAPEPDSGKESRKKKLINIVIAAVVCVVLVVVLIIGIIGGYRYWQRRKRLQEQARFLKLFEEHDDMEDELGLEEMI